MLPSNHVVADRYRIVRHIATGGMGAVYEAEHLATEARVALKLLLPQMLEVSAARRRFELEARVAARVNSEHIVRVLDAGVDSKTGSPYLAMELLAGETLAARIKRGGPLGRNDAIEVLRQVARGLDAAHGYRAADGTLQPIVHRDLKPENLFLTRRADGATLVKILDFGIAKVLSDATAVSREVRGTPLYMAYEQLAGETVSPQTDIWALGLIAHFVLSGRTYWAAANGAIVGAEALFAQILTLPLPRPSQRLGDGIGPRLPPAFDTWLLTCIERNSSRRFSSAGAAVTALERALASLDAHPAGPMLGGSFGSRETARYELPRAASSLSVTSVPPVASERSGRVAPGRWRGWLDRRGVVLSGVLLVGSVAWVVTSFRARFTASDVGARREPASTPITSVAPAPAVEPLLEDEARVPRAPEAVAPVEPATAPRASEPSSASSAPRVTLRALEPAAPPSTPPSPVPPRVSLSPRPPALEPSAHSVVPRSVFVARDNPASMGGSSSGLPAPKPGLDAPADAPCARFDPYTGRCAAAGEVRDLAERR